MRETTMTTWNHPDARPGDMDHRWVLDPNTLELTIDEEDEPVLMFVYGTLRPGEGFHRAVEDAVLAEVDKCTTPGALYVSGLPFASLGPRGDGGTVVGTLLTFDPSVAMGPPHRGRDEHGRVVEFPAHRVVEVIRRIEENAHYVRRAVPVTLPDGSVVEAEAWHHPGAGDADGYHDWEAARVTSGDYRDSENSHVAYLRRRDEWERKVADERGETLEVAFPGRRA